MSAAQSLSEVACKAGTGSKALRNIPVKCIASFEVPGTSAMLHESLHAGVCTCLLQNWTDPVMRQVAWLCILHADEGHCAGAQGEELHEFVEATLRGRQLKGVRMEPVVMSAPVPICSVMHPESWMLRLPLVCMIMHTAPSTGGHPLANYF